MSQSDLDKFRNTSVTLESLGISTKAEDLAIMPSIGEAFPAGSIIAHWNAGIFYWFMTSEDYALFNETVNPSEKVPIPDLRRKMGDWFHHYYRSYERAMDAMYKLNPQAVENKYRPQTQWVFYAATDTVLNRTAEGLKNMQDGFGEQILFSVHVMRLQNGNARFPLGNRHQFNLIALPAAVAAVADLYKYPNAGYDLSELLEPGVADTFNDESFFALCGDPEGRYEDSVLYQRRVALWKSLGEEDPKASAMLGSLAASGKPNKAATTSEKLSTCLAITQGRWERPIWCRVTSVPNPYGYNEKQPKNLPALTEIFVSEEHARAVAAADLAERGEEAAAAVSFLPENWQSAGLDEWVKFFKENDDPSVTAASAPPAKAALLKTLFADSIEQVIATRAYIAEQG